MPCAREFLRSLLRWNFRAFLFLGVLWGSAAWAQPDSTHLQLELGFGHEAQTSPLFQISPDSSLIYQGGQQSLEGANYHTNLQGSAEWLWSEGASTTVSAALSIKRAPRAPGMEMRSLSLSPAAHFPMGSASVGMGLELQSIEVGGAAFRQVNGLQWDWTRPDGDTLLGLVANVSQYRHPDALQELDARALSLVMLWQQAKPFPGVEAFHLTAIVGREINANGYDDLSQHSRMVSMAIHGSLAGFEWTLGRSWRRATFEDTLFPGEPPRDDLSTMTDVGISWALNDRQRLRLEANHVRNSSNTSLYDNQYVQYSLTWIHTF